MIDVYKDDAVAAHQFNAAEELEEIAVLEGLNLSSPSAVRQSAAKARNSRDAAISSLHKSIADGLKNFDIIGDTQELYELIYKSDDYFDKRDGSLERAVDLHLQNMDKTLARQDWEQTTGDTQLLMAWLEKVQDNFRRLTFEIIVMSVILLRLRIAVIIACPALSLLCCVSSPCSRLSSEA